MESHEQSVDFSDPSWIAATVLVICSASLSVVGSSTIVYKIVRDLAQRPTTPYDRIIFCLSSGDILASVNYALVPFLLYNASPASCQAWGILFQLSSLAVWYNFILSLYFLVTVVSQVRRKDYVRKCELWMHLSGIYFPIIAIIFYCHGWTGVIDGGTGCAVVEPIFLRFAFGPIIFTFLFMATNYGLIYAVVRKSLRSSSNEPSEIFGAGRSLVQKQLMREAITMMLLYVGCFFVTWLPVFVRIVIGTNFFSRIFAALLLPLQGFFNVFIYLKPAYTRFRAVNPNKSMYFVLHQALFNPKIPQLNNNSSSHPSASNAIALERDMGISGINFESNLFINEDVGEDEYSSDSSDSNA